MSVSTQKIYWTPEKVACQAEILLEKYNPKTFNINFFRQHNDRLHGAIQRHFKKSESENPYSDFIKLLDYSWQSRFLYNRADMRNFTFPKAVLEVENLVETHRPKYFGPTFIAKHNRKLFDFFCKELKNGETVEWVNLFNNLKPDIQKLWKERPRVGNSLNEDIAILKALLESLEPTSFNLRWIAGRNKRLATRFENKVYGSNGKITWELIFNQLGDDRSGQPWINRWIKKRFYADLIPKTISFDPIPVEKIKELHKDKLYVFVEHLNKVDRIHFEEISTKLIRLAQGGNSVALEFLQSSIYFTVQRLIDNNRLNHNQILLSRLINYQGKVDETITRCIYTFSFRGKFFSYLYKTLIGLSWQVGLNNFSFEDEMGTEKIKSTLTYL